MSRTLSTTPPDPPPRARGASRSGAPPDAPPGDLTSAPLSAPLNGQPGGEKSGLPAFSRAEAIRRLGCEHFDVAVIGGGITGAGVALDAASRGLKVALVEKGDFASGTSSKSSKMVHGGLRYLQQREIRLVYENLAERQRLLDNAPHLVTPLPFLIPLLGRSGAVSKTVARSYSTALWLYDITGGFRIGSRHRRVSRQEALGHLPSLRADRLVAGFLYFDARADDARLTLALLRTAALDYGAVVANYLVAESLFPGAGTRVRGIRVRPLDPTGNHAGTASRTEIDVSASVVVNATGVWADTVAILDREPGHSIRPAKGVHVTVPADRLPCDIAAVIPVPNDRRSIFVVPWPEKDHVYIGTTDTDYQGDLDKPGCTAADVDYLLDAVNALTTSSLTRADVTAVWAGLRPLLAPSGTGKQSARTADLSRRHTVRTSPTGLVTVTGGKLTTYRKMAEDAMAEVMKALPDRASANRCVTKRLPLRGSPPPGSGPSEPAPRSDLPEPDRRTPGPTAKIDPTTRAHLWNRYGTELEAVLFCADERPALLEPIVDGLPYIGAEVVYSARCEMAMSVDDVLSRRTRALLQDARAAAAAAEKVAALLAPELGWTTEQAARQAASFSEQAFGELAEAGLPADQPSPDPSEAVR